MARQPFTFVRGPDTLNGWIEDPDGPGPHPAMIMVHGSGRSDVARWGDDELRSRLRRAGVAVAVWDKPGCGLSAGTFDDDLRRRADEAVAAVAASRGGAASIANASACGASARAGGSALWRRSAAAGSRS